MLFPQVRTLMYHADQADQVTRRIRRITAMHTSLSARSLHEVVEPDTPLRYDFDHYTDLEELISMYSKNLRRAYHDIRRTRRTTQSGRMTGGKSQHVCVLAA